MTREPIHDFASHLVALILGIDQLYRSTIPGELKGLAREGWVAINLSHVPPWQIDSYEQARELVRQLERELADLNPTRARRRYYSDYLTAVDTFCRWQSGETLPYEELTHGLLGTPGKPPELTPILSALEDRLREAGFSGELQKMVAAFRESRTVPGDQAVATLTGYIGRAREWVDQELFSMPADFQFRVEGERNLPYDAYCGYVERMIRINLDMQFTHEDLKHLACHEAFPGHSTHIFRRETLVAQGSMPEDGLLVVTDTPTNTIFEGVGEIGLTLLGWDKSEPEQVNRLLIRLLAAVSAWASYLFAKGQRDEGIELLHRYRDAAWADSRRLLLDLPLRRPFLYTYFYGDQVVREAQAQAGDRRSFLTHLYDRMHSPGSILMAE